MNLFCTLFDSGYLVRALAMYRSLEAQDEPFRLLAYCFDDEAHALLGALAPRLPHLEAVLWREHETDALRAAKAERTRGEYCWTCTPFVLKHAMARGGAPDVTYLDADLYFFAPASLLLDEVRLSSGSVLITEHRYTPRYDQTATSGRYCVQFVTFRDEPHGREALGWWADRCLEWCYDRFEDGRFGDQKYLDDWTTRFRGVRVLQHLGGGVAPWNVQRYRVAAGPTVDGVPVVFFHFHGLRWMSGGWFDLSPGGYRLEPEVVEHLYRPYLEALKRARDEVRAVRPGFEGGQVRAPARPVYDRLRRVKRRLEGTYHVVRE